MNLSHHTLKNNASIFSVIVSAFVVIITQLPVQAGKIEEIAQQATVQINSEIVDSPGGSGVIIKKQGKVYTVLTANHVVCDALVRRKQVTCPTDITYTIHTYNGRDYPIKDRQILKKTSSDPDLALVTFEAQEDYAIAPLGNSQDVKREADIKVTGFPVLFGNLGKNRTYTVTNGKVVTFNPRADEGYTLVYDANTFIGNSGGPVFDVYGRVIGIHGQADAGSLDGKDSTKEETISRRKPKVILPIKPKIGQKETGTSTEQKTGFNAAIPINTFFALTGQKPPAPMGNVIPPKIPPTIATGGNTVNFSSTTAKLEELLSQGNWKEADEETKSLLLRLSQASGSLNEKTISRLPCESLRAINQVWQTKSQGRFGFSVQAQKWKSLFGNKFEPTNEHFGDFADDLGWRYRGRYLYNNQLKYTPDAPQGHLPKAFLDGPVWGNFVAHLDTCKL